MTKLFVDSNQFYNLSLSLAKTIEEDDLNPDFILGVSRGGCVPSIVIHEYLNYKGIKCDYGIVSVKLYNEDNTRGNNIIIDMSEYIMEKLKVCNNILIIDDVLDTGYTFRGIGNYLYDNGINSNKFNFACVYYKSIKNETTIIPKYYEQCREEWVVFPHELVGLSDKEVEFKFRE